jgi:23S rRNA (cytosine1962-C5)-methyltransferase
MVRQLAAGKNVLNLFAYTGSFTVYAAAGGARSTTSVDLSNTYQEWTRKNLQLNGFQGDEHGLIREDVFTYLERSVRERKVFGLIVLDPPSFSNSKKMQEILDIQRDHPRLIQACLALLRPGGVLFFSNNLRQFKLDPEIAELADCQEITRQTTPDDFARHPLHRCWRFEKS